MASSIHRGNDDDPEDALCKLPLPGMREEAKAATEKFLLDSISKADAHVTRFGQQPKGMLSDIFRDLSGPSGLCAWHSRKLARLLSLVRAGNCDIGMIQSLEGPLEDFFNRDLDNGFLVSVKDYKFYAGIKLEGCTEDGGIDNDLLDWITHSVSKMGRRNGPRDRSANKSLTRESIVVEDLTATEGDLEEWKRCIHSVGTKESMLQKAKVKMTHLFSDNKRADSDDSQDQMPLGASPEQFESLINGMQTLLEGVRKKLPTNADVTSSQHERVLILIRDDIRIQVKWTRDPGFLGMWTGSTAYQVAQDLEARVRNWVQNETELCEFRDEVVRQVEKRWKR